MFQPDKKSSLDRVNKSLYSRTETPPEIPRHDIHGSDALVGESWQEPEVKEPVHTLSPGIRKAYKITFVVSFIFFALAFLVGIYTFSGGKNFVSVDNVDIQIEGPTSVGGGQALALNVSVVNKNATDMQLVDLVAKYPAGTKDPADPTKDLNQTRISLGDIKPQSLAQRPITAVLFGEEGAGRDIVFTAEYRTEDSNAVFYKEKTYHITISSSPVLVSVDALDNVLANEASDITITVASNSAAPIKNLLLTLDYPFGFSVVSSNPQPTYGDNTWRIGDLAAGAKKTFTIKASMQGDDGDQKAIHANVGIQSETNPRQIATTIISRDHTFMLERPFLGLSIAMEGNTTNNDIVVSGGRSVHADVIWTNNSANKITGAKIVATLGGNALDKNSVIPDDGGYYDSAANTITWQAGRTNGLDSIAPGASDRAGFGFSTVTTSPGQALSNPVITVTVTGSGSRIDDSGSPQDITTGVTRSVKLVSNLALSAQALHSQGPISNSGPVPPRVDQATTYTVVWTVTNTSNIITGAKVTATVPQYMKWTGVMSPSNANVTYDAASGALTWIVGEVPRNATVGNGAKQVAFQLSLTPSANQVGDVPTIISSANISGTDVFTGATVQNTAQSLSTRTSTDLLFKQGDDVVTQ